MASFRSYLQLALARVGGWKWRHDCIFHPQLARHEAIPTALWPRSSTPKSKSANHAKGWPVYVCAATSDAPGASIRALVTSAQTARGTPMRRASCGSSPSCSMRASPMSGLLSAHTVDEHNANLVGRKGVKTVDWFHAHSLNSNLRLPPSTGSISTTKPLLYPS